MSNTGFIRLAAPILIALFAIFGFAPGAQGADPAPYMRLVEPADGKGRVDLQIAARRFVPANGAGPAIWLTGVVHIGEVDYYAAVQKHLDAQNLVLFEGVGHPPFMENKPPVGNEAIVRTQAAIRFAGAQATRAARAKTAAEPTLDAVGQWIEANNFTLLRFFKRARVDGWGRPLRYQPNGKTFTLVSYGADGKEGGAGADADLSLADQAPFDEGELAPPHGLQSDLAAALGMAFQLQAIDYERKHFVHSDLKARQVGRFLRKEGQDKIADNPGQMQQLMRTLQGQSLMGKFLKLGIRLIAISPRMRAMTKLTLMETMGQLKGDLAKAQGLGADMSRLLKKLIVDRNKIVMRDLARAIEADNPPASISVFYGAGHMFDLQQRLEQEQGYKAAEDLWMTAMRFDPAKSGLSPAEVQQVKTMVRFQLKQMMPKQ